MTVGMRLREARERQKVSLHAIAERTNISVRFLDAIEKNQFEKLPGGIFTRGFIRSYAAQVGLDPDSTVAQFLSDEPDQRDDDIDEAPSSDRERLGIGLVVAAGLAVIVLAAAAVYVVRPTWLGIAPRTSAVAPAEAVAPEPATEPPVEAAAATQPPAAPPATAPPANVAQDDAEPPATTAAEAPKSPLHLVIMPTGRCWVQVSADGQMRVAREFGAGERLAIDAADRLHVTVGDAGSFAYELNGRPGKSLGAAGSVARATILPSTVAQFQIQ